MKGRMHKKGQKIC